MRLAIKKHWVDFLAIAGLALIGVGITIYLLSQQDFRFPLVEPTPKHISIELANAQAVEPGQGQTVRVAGVEVGRISGVKLEDGVAVVRLDDQVRLREPDPRGRDRAAAPEDALKDMFVEVNPGTGSRCRTAAASTVANSLPDIDPDEIYCRARRGHAPVPEAAGRRSRKGPAGPRRRPARGLPAPRADPPRPRAGHARQRERRHELKELIHDYGLLMTELGKHPQDLRRLVTASHAVFDALAKEDTAISAVRRPAAGRR